MTPKVIAVDSKPHIGLMASRDIEVGEELLYDYGERSKEVTDVFPWLLE